MLLRQIKVEKDAEIYQDFKDLGYRNMPEYAGHKDLPAGHWVYVAPYWYIWRDLTSVQRPKRDWGPEQATGEPDTNMAGDIVTAWASASQDGQEEWLMLEYDEFVGADRRAGLRDLQPRRPLPRHGVQARRRGGRGVEGRGPHADRRRHGRIGDPGRTDFKTNRVKLYIDSPSVPGWNEIDAVGLRDKAKKMHWAVAADASTTYAQPYPPDGRAPTCDR